MTLYEVHGALQALAFLVVFPLGILMLAMQKFRLHALFQLLGSALVLMAFAVVHIAERVSPPSLVKPSPSTQRHHRVGTAVVGLVLLQLVWALALKRHLPWGMWYAGHALLGTGVLLGGWYNLWLAYQMRRA